MESLKAIAMAPSRAEQESFAASSRRREENIRREARLDEINRINDREAREAALMNFYASEQPAQPAQETNILSQMSPTQLTYLLGELGYDITPKATAADTSAPITPIPQVTTPSEVPSVMEPSTTVTPTIAPLDAEVLEFKTREEADAARLPIGTRVKIGGRDAIIT